MNTRNYFICLNVANFLRETKYPNGYEGVFSTGGKDMSPREAHDFLLVEVAKGHKVIPCSSKCGHPCEQNGCPGFDFSGGGCGGYVEEDAA